MDTSLSYCPLDGLPIEIVEMIFDRLDLESLKSLSLTCHRWERLFLQYCSRRFVLRIDEKITLDVDVAFMNYEDRRMEKYLLCEEKMKVAVIMLEQTQRVYRTVHIDFHLELATVIYKLKILNRLFKPHLLQQLTVLKLDMGNDPVMHASDISRAVQKMENLQELYIAFNVRTPHTTECYTMHLVNPTLQKLVIKGITPYVVDCANLWKLDVAESLHVESIIGGKLQRGVDFTGHECYWKIDQLTELSIVNDLKFNLTTRSSILRFYRQLCNVTRLYLYGHTLTQETLQVICESCVQLEEFTIGNLQMDDPNALRYLSNLPNLRQFGIWKILNGNPLSFASVKLPKLEKLLLGCMAIDWPSLASVRSISWLKIKPGPVIDAPICRALSGTFAHLRFLWIDVHTTRVARELLAQLLQMHWLETLVLENIVHLRTLKTLPALPQLERLIIYRCSKKVYERYYNNEVLAKLVRDIRWIRAGQKIVEERGIKDSFEC
ncbi:uncharacterized protein LOC120901664 [Anopheles arabiensis]|uniref:F-box domain-containing protein n=2 Tax=gambiae species complex TaxID=44542 RepID=A0A453YZ39_ANOGA|nr:uncharacterized protein LOC120901664 [Anopheles arabiensis]